MSQRVTRILLAATFVIACVAPPSSLRAAEEEPVLAAAFPDTDKLISMNFDGALLKDVLKILSQQSGLNFAASEEVELKKVTVYLENVPVKDALESIVNANGLRYDRKPGSSVFVVMASEDSSTGIVTKVFVLKYKRLSISPLDVGAKSVVSDLLKPEEVSALATSTGGGGGAAAGGSEVAEESTESLVAERGIDKIVESLLSEEGKMTVDLGTNSLIVTDQPASLARIERILEKIDVPTEQVMIEVHLIEVKKTTLDDIGVEWGGTNGALFEFQGGERTTSFPFKESIFNENSQFRLPLPTDKAELTLGTLSAANFAAVLRFITSKSDAKILARPRVLSHNNEAANIKLVTRAAIARTSTITASEGITTLQTGQAERTEVGISLKLTPQVNEGKFVTLFLEPSVTTVSASTFFPTDFLDPTTRTVRTTARVQDHETLVIGGLIDRDDTVSVKKIPFLGDMPLVGTAFSYKDKNDIDRELLIFITPHIVKGPYASGSTSPGKDVAVKRMLDYFVEDEFERAVTPLMDQDRDTNPIYKEEKRLIQSGTKRASSPSLDREMGRALDSLSQKNANPS